MQNNIKIGKKCINLVLLSLSLCLNVWAEDIPFTDENCIKACLGEARGEGYHGLLLCAVALRNRGTLKGVYGFRAKFYEPKRIWDLARKAWSESEYNRFHDGTHWESTDFPVPKWSKNMIVVCKYKKHIFYRRQN